MGLTYREWGEAMATVTAIVLGGVILTAGFMGLAVLMGRLFGYG